MDEDGKTWRKMERHEGRQKDTEEDGKTYETIERHEPMHAGRYKKTMAGMLERDNVDTNHNTKVKEKRKRVPHI